MTPRIHRLLAVTFRRLAPCLLVLLLATGGGAELAAQTDLAAQSLRPYWHVFLAYAVGWVLILGWVISIARRLARIERRLEE